jgi:hypothetical protein
MTITGCSAMAVYCLERAESDVVNRAKWTAQAERWKELAHAEKSWRLQKKQPQQAMHTGPMDVQRQQG